MAGELLQSPNAFLLLLLLDGRLCCVSAEDGKVCWMTQLPGGPLFYCEERCVKKDEKQTCTPFPSVSTYSGLQNLSESNSQKSCADDIVSGQESSFEEIIENVNTECCLVSFPPGDTAPPAPPLEWYFRNTSSSCVEDETPWLPVDNVIERWNISLCHTRRAVDLQHKTMSYMELDFLTGKLLYHLFPEGGVENTAESNSFNNLSSLRITVQRTDFARNVLFPPPRTFLHVDVNSTENKFSPSWYAVTSAVAFDVLNICDDNLLPELWEYRESHSYYIGQSLKTNEFISRLYVTEALETVREVEFIDLTSPVVSAYIVWLRRSLSDADSTEILKPQCQEIRVINFVGYTQTESVSKWNLQDCNGTVQTHSGFFDSNKRVLFLESITSRSFMRASSFNSDVHERRDADSSPLRGFFAYDGVEADQSPTRDSLDAVGSTSPSENSDNMAVLETRVMSSFHSSQTGTVVPVHRDPSFFDDNFEVLQLLGRGSSGAVLLTRHRLTGVFYAVKVVLVPNYLRGNEAYQEARLHALLENNNIVRYHACWSEAVTQHRLLQLASIGLCHPKKMQQLGLIRTSGRIECGGYQRCAPCQINCGANWSMTSDRFLIKPNLLLAPPHLTQENKATGLYLAGTDSLDSSLFTSRRTVTGSEEEEDGNLWKERSSSPSRKSKALLEGQVVFLQLEYCHTTLAHRLGSRTSIDRVENIIIALQIFSALRYLHRCGYLHRDVKPTNVLLDYRSQRVALDDTSDDDDDDNDNDGSCSEKEAKAIKNNGVDVDSTDEYTHTRDMMTTYLTPGVSSAASSSSALDLIRANAGVGSLASILKRWKRSQGESEKRQVIRAVRKWLKQHLVQVRLGDFGLSKLIGNQSIEDSGYFDHAEVNTVGVGSPQYSSPEQLEGGICAAASDAFAAGILLAEMYIQPKTVAERLCELQRARQGVFPDSTLLLQYPELQVVEGLTRRDPGSRMTLRDASRVLVKTVDRILLSFFSETNT